MKRRFILGFVGLIVLLCIQAQDGEIVRSDSPALKGPQLEPEPPGNSPLWGQSAPREPLVLIYVANMGVMVSSGEVKVLIDGLFDEPNPGLRVPSPETLASLMKGEASFDGVDLVLVTHKDWDHFSAALVARYLETRPEPILVAPSDAVAAMRKAASDWSRIEPRIIPIELEVGENIKREVARIPLTIVRTLHGMTKTPMNLMYLIEVNGWRVFHEGDSSGRPDDFLGFGLETLPVDLAVISPGWPLSPHLPHRRFLQDVLKPNHIALGHINIKVENVVDGEIDKVRQYYNDIFVLLPGMPAKLFRK